MLFYKSFFVKIISKISQCQIENTIYSNLEVKTIESYVEKKNVKKVLNNI
jgi:hypothetical protein